MNRPGARLLATKYPMVSPAKGSVGCTSVKLHGGLAAAWGKFHPSEEGMQMYASGYVCSICAWGRALWCNELCVATKKERARLSTTQKYMLRRSVDSDVD